MFSIVEYDRKCILSLIFFAGSRDFLSNRPFLRNPGIIVHNLRTTQKCWVGEVSGLEIKSELHRIQDLSPKHCIISLVPLFLSKTQVQSYLMSLKIPIITFMSFYLGNICVRSYSFLKNKIPFKNIFFLILFLWNIFMYDFTIVKPIRLAPLNYIQQGSVTQNEINVQRHPYTSTVQALGPSRQPEEVYRLAIYSV